VRSSPRSRVRTRYATATVVPKEGGKRDVCVRCDGRGVPSKNSANPTRVHATDVGHARSGGWTLTLDRASAAALELVEAPKLPELSEVPFAPEC